LLPNSCLEEDKEHGHGHSHEGHGHAHGDEQKLIDTTDHGHSHALEVVPVKDEEKAAEEKKRRNINVQAAYLHILGDLLNSFGVVIASTCIYIWPSLWYLDPTCTLFFAVIVMYTTRLTFYQCIEILMEATPDDVEVEEVQKAFEQVENVVDVHDLHIWALT
jgi:zinc transporter 2